MTIATRAKQDRHKIYVAQVIARYMYFKHDGYHKERELGYRNNRGTRRRGCIPVFPSFARRYVTFGGVEVPRRIPRATKAHPILRTTPTKDNGPFLMVSFSSAPEMASSTTTSQAPRRRSPGLFTIFLKRSPEHQSPSQLGGHPPRVTSSRSLTRTNRGGELNTMQ